MQNHNPLVAHFVVPKQSSLSSFCKNWVGLSEKKIRTLLRLGAVYLNGRRLLDDVTLSPQDVLRFHFRPKRFPKFEIETVYSDDWIIIVDKPAGLPTHPTLDNAIENAVSLASQSAGQKLFVTHRLDTQTAGLLILAKSEKSQARINSLFADRKVTKVYRALTEIPPPLGRHVHHMELGIKPPKRVLLEPTSETQPAILRIEKVWKVSRFYASEIHLETGRTHQIRAQLAFLGCPIVGDKLYGSSKNYVPERIALESYHLSLVIRSGTIGVFRPTSLVAPHSTKDFLLHSEISQSAGDSPRE